MLHTTTNSGLHDFVGERVLANHVRRGDRALDLGSGPGAMADRLRQMGCDVLAADLSDAGFEPDIPHINMNFNDPEFASKLGRKTFAVITAIEVIEHVETPIGFLRNIRHLLAPEGLAVVTTPNVDSLPARLKFLLTGKIRTMDEHGEPTHISPIFFDLLCRQYLPLAGLRLRQHLLFPSNGFQLSRRSVALAMQFAARVIPGESISGDNHILVLESRL